MDLEWIKSFSWEWEFWIPLQLNCRMVSMDLRSLRGEKLEGGEEAGGAGEDGGVKELVDEEEDDEGEDGGGGEKG